MLYEDEDSDRLAYFSIRCVRHRASDHLERFSVESSDDITPQDVVDKRVQVLAERFEKGLPLFETYCPKKYQLLE